MSWLGCIRLYVLVALVSVHVSSVIVWLVVCVVLGLVTFSCDWSSRLGILH